MDEKLMSIFQEDGSLVPIEKRWLEPDLVNKICVRGHQLAHYVQNQKDIPEDVKREILQQLDGIYYCGKRMHLTMLKTKRISSDEK